MKIAFKDLSHVRISSVVYSIQENTVNNHKCTRLALSDHQEIWQLYQNQIGCAYSNSGMEFKGTGGKACRQHGIGQKLTPRPTAKPNASFRTLMDIRHSQVSFKGWADRRIQLFRFINFYNTVKPHKSLNNAPPYEILIVYFNQLLCKQP